MTDAKDQPAAAAIKDLLSRSPDALREIVHVAMQEMLEAEMTDAPQAEKSERTSARRVRRLQKSRSSWAQTRLWRGTIEPNKHW